MICAEGKEAQPIEVDHVTRAIIRMAIASALVPQQFDCAQAATSTHRRSRSNVITGTYREPVGRRNVFLGYSVSTR